MEGLANSPIEGSAWNKFVWQKQKIKSNQSLSKLYIKVQTLNLSGGYVILTHITGV